MNKRRANGSSHSTRPVRTGSPKWVRFSREEVEMLIEELAKKGYTPSMIGIVLRDQYGIPLAKPIIGKKVNQFLKDKGLASQIPEDLFNLIRRAVNVRRHLNEYPGDKTAKKGLEEIESKIRRLSRYYKRVEKLPQDWTYDPAKAELLVSASS
ncbi:MULTISPECIES: 30S ribosomal protein S15 [Metallosphaera]|uniref:Small ribosomal subunit protein uS15 n=3 Tax=Metallosphaera TaxID=41980 RepID=RS15_METS5|nr:MULTISPECIES: 30S ribosomal protein S15 [Metallosphaera]A4YIY3.1 RecName: Full=Small ribosomal subunit protein uS15; AltName: Full=30S ribosomal protein S15 [Metallosphaera sedula DSM 5348]ABP96385.1 SSU ribosomal protein S15P [Metallosphaera sedula DSM 5348]AIM28368.1 SSU ribosomal protein S15P [Metallosphaera sedula]AKV75162.1 30S ribosomal protein S15 [Metallosphaera sedula]AKV77398.1 30S ribosomal protein S15 [Metallosphaera sedula]AKV79650.1 30S ribosomal protein S15 [Metallosphaera s